MSWGEEVGIVRYQSKQIDEAEKTQGSGSFRAALEADFQVKHDHDDQSDEEWNK